ncbi:hypothetical protein PHYPSEUDO_014211 [Phytophthora pseudosyringae]|uniref:Uncharacterized protein n=1 Tax=Phytophthora pseudosyringae TaxID=221518 RepID=A0A8T1V5G3_9STRA|nr:hypothetical protein PHYPSEUDO_014211 [Phytophthora pseudosyringae]
MEQTAFSNLSPGLEDDHSKLMSLLGPEGVSHLAAQGPDAVNTRLEAFSNYGNALLEHLQQRMTAAVLSMASTAAQDGASRPKLLIVNVKTFEGKEGETSCYGSVRSKWRWDQPCFVLSNSAWH